MTTTLDRCARSLLAALFLFAACQAVDSAPPETPRFGARTLYDTVGLRAVSFAPDGESVLFSSDESGVYNAYAISADGSKTTQLTDSSSDAITAISFFPSDRRLIFQKDQGGNELVHVYVRELDGTSRDLTPGEKVKARFLLWSGDDRSFFVATNERDASYFDVYRYATDGYARTLLFENQGGFEIGDVSLDGRSISLLKVNNNSDNDVFLWDASQPASAPRKLSEHTGEISHGDMSFAADGRELFFTSNEGSEFQRLWGQELANGTRRLVHEAPWDVQSVSCTRDGRYRVLTINADARTQVLIQNLATSREVELPDLGTLDIQDLDISRDGRRLACLAWSDTSPANVFVVELGARKAKQLTRTLAPGVEERALVRSEVVRYSSYDGLKIPALLYRPHSATPGQPVPALLWIHGGPGGQSRTGYNPAIQHLVNNGVAVLAVNNRGSSGYGKTFHHLDDRRHGEADLDDCVWARRWLAQQPWCDGERIGIMGGSYGGYMVLAALAYRPQEFALGIDIFGVSNWLRTLESIPPWWASFRDSLYAEIGDPVADRERLSRQSPLFHADKIVRPLLVVQGANDPRVLQVESDEIVAACRRNGVPVEYLLFPDEGHGFQRKQNRIAASEAYLSFVNSHWPAGQPLEFVPR
jgi:prolyl oligopeptidase